MGYKSILSPTSLYVFSDGDVTNVWLTTSSASSSDEDSVKVASDEGDDSEHSTSLSLCEVELADELSLCMSSFSAG